MVRISNIALSIGLSASMSCYGMNTANVILQSDIPSNKKIEQLDLHINALESAVNPYERAQSIADKILAMDGKLLHAKAAKRMVEENKEYERAQSIEDKILEPFIMKTYERAQSIEDKILEPFIMKTDDRQPDISPQINNTKKEFIKVPTPKHITLVSKEIEAKDKIAAFKAMMNATSTIMVVKDLETLKNSDIKKIREVGNYTMFGDSQNHKWVVDNETGIDVALSQEMIEKVMQLSTEDIERMLKNDAFNEQSIDNNLEVMNKKQ
jgi:hypothetical protein